MERLTDRLIIISFDCLSSLDFSMLQELPHFKSFLQTASYCKNVETIYPSVTYPCHTTIVTGKFPKHHGIINNTLLQPGRLSPDWYWHRHYVKGTTLYDEAKKSGMTTAALLWPVTAKANIDYNMPEIFANRPWHHQIPVSLMNGSVRFQLEMNKQFGHIRKGLSQPELDDFVLESTVHTIKAYKPNLLLVHFTDLDTQRHFHGFSSEQAHEALRRHDIRLGRMIQALKDSGQYEDSTIIVLGDHSALDEAKAIKPNVLLKDQGLIQINKQGHVAAWDAYCKSCDGSAYIYVKDEQTQSKVAGLLQKLMEDESTGIEMVLTSKEAGARGADEHAAFMIEARQGYYFTEYLDGNLIDDITEQDVEAGKYTVVSHGYSPDKPDYTTVFMASGKGIETGIVLPTMHLVDEGPTFARLLGVDLGNTDGRILEEIIVKNK
ncbi:ectonucleotide pyrophosphatase/phosphodiesterase [Bacillus sp. FJAT-50079]|uniref:alkaline phosphatase family protein n=1 Tax=Bacillus sp. FJAT-50079 TaxID=2833577 RepID=UPI001BC92BF0|nr:alkaline phosphatase family protein [Bacillus sp. FJAT-50079]